MFGNKYHTFQFSMTYVEENGFPLAPLHLPEISNESFSIEHQIYEKGKELDFVNVRMSLLAGIKRGAIKLDENWVNQILYEYSITDGNQTWMSTAPVETFTHIYPALNAHGNVLVGGLGLGYILHMMNDLNSKISSITCIEINPHLVDLIASYMPSMVETTVDDIFNYLKTTNKKFDFIYLDTWGGTGEYEFIKTVHPLRKLAERVLVPSSDPKLDINCWMEEVMRGQFLTSIIAPLMLKDGEEAHVVRVSDEYMKINPVACQFFRDHNALELEAMSIEEQQEVAREFVDNY